MAQSKSFVLLIVGLLVGLIIGFLVRPIVDPAASTAAVSPLAPTIESLRGVQYFAANLGEARRIIDGCKAGAVRGGECANAGQAVATADARARTKRFLGRPDAAR